MTATGAGLEQEKQTPGLWAQYQTAKAAASGPYFPREGAAVLGVSEGELMASAPDTVYLGTDMARILPRLAALGEVESIVRNSTAVHEKAGRYENVRWSAQGGLALNIGGVDLRFFPAAWRHALAVTTEARGRPSRSVQFYDANGVALQKVFLREGASLQAWSALLAECACPGLPVFQAACPEPTLPPQPLDDAGRVAFHAAWAALQDVHDFGSVLQQFGIDRLAAYEQAPPGSSRRLLSASVWERLLQQVRDSGMEAMMFVGNHGLVQIHTGPIHKVVRARGYLNVLDDASTGFNLHLQDEALAQTWVVRRPVAGGFVTCVEGFDRERRSVIQLFGRRHEGERELASWQAITDDWLLGKVA